MSAMEPVTAVVEIIKRFGVFGLLAILWTLVVCSALLAADQQVILQIWDRLFWTWLTTAAVLAGTGVLTSVAAAIKKLREGSGGGSPSVTVCSQQTPFPECSAEASPEVSLPEGTPGSKPRSGNTAE